MTLDVWPNVAWWGALQDGRVIEQELFGRRLAVSLSVVPCGELKLPYGRLVVCDPFASLEPDRNPHLKVRPGAYPVYITVADVSVEGDGSHLREAYATLVLSDEPELERRALQLLRDGEPPSAEPLAPGEFFGFGVDAGTACFVDDGSVLTGMPAPDDWYEGVFEHGSEHSWFDRMDDPDDIQSNLANVPLPLSQDGSNIILIHSGWGDGFYPVVGGFGADGQLVRVYIDFGVICDPTGVSDIHE